MTLVSNRDGPMVAAGGDSPPPNRPAMHLASGCQADYSWPQVPPTPLPLASDGAPSSSPPVGLAGPPPFSGDLFRLHPSAIRELALAVGYLKASLTVGDMVKLLVALAMIKEGRSLFASIMHEFFGIGDDQSNHDSQLFAVVSGGHQAHVFRRCSEHPDEIFPNTNAGKCKKCASHKKG